MIKLPPNISTTGANRELLRVIDNLVSTTQTEYSLRRAHNKLRAYANQILPELPKPPTAVLETQIYPLENVKSLLTKLKAFRSKCTSFYLPFQKKRQPIDREIVEQFKVEVSRLVRYRALDPVPVVTASK